jgi:protein MpaA
MLRTTVLILALVLACCASSRPDRQPVSPPPELPAAGETAPAEATAAPAAKPAEATARPTADVRPPVREIVLGRSVRGRPIRCRILGDGPTTVLFLATIHGNEPAGTPLLERLEEQLLEHPERLTGRRVLLVPVANPDGHAAGTRGNARGIDLNRNFPAGNHGGDARGGRHPLSEPESRALHALITRHRPVLVVSLHQPLALIDHDGPARPLAEAMARETDLPVRKLGGRPGSMGSWVGIDRRTPIVTVELPPRVEGLGAEALWRRYGRMLLTAIAFRTTP